MKNASIIFIAGILILSVWGCSGKQELPDGVLARVDSHTLTRSDVEAVMPVGLSDSAYNAYVNHYVEEWVISHLVYDLARKNLPDVQQLDKMVENYRHDLFNYEYRKRLSDERLANVLTEDTMLTFYNTHKEEFKLRRPIVKGIMLKIPYNAPQLSSVRKWMKERDENSIESIEKYALKSAIGYDYFLDRWVWFDDVKDIIPYEFTGDAEFLSQNKFFEHRHEDIIYLLSIDSYLNKGDIMPYEFAEPLVRELLMNEYRVEFNKELDKSLFDKASSEGRVELFL